MKINDAEKRLGITKANIRFYEKENLITPSRTENGYRDYSEGDIARLKQIIILRKLGIPVGQIQDILDGVLPLQEAVDANILALQQEIEKLNGSLSLCCQLKREDAQTLDTERYWDLIRKKEQEGYLFQSLIHDYISFVDDKIRSHWTIPEDKRQDNKQVVKHILLHAVIMGLFTFVLGLGFFRMFSWWIYLDVILPFLLGLFLIPAFLIRRKSEKYGKIADILIRITLAVILLYFWMRSAFT